MNPAIDAEGVAEKAAYLRSCGWFAEGETWSHRALPALPPLSLAAAWELAQAAALDALGRDRHDPAGPSRQH